MLKVGLTGNIASGKSTVARVWEGLGATVIDADRLARAAVEPGTPALAAIVEEWGDGILDSEGRLDRAALRDVVFRDPAARRRLEEIVHPAVAELREREHVAAVDRGERIVVSDIPLLFEVGLEGEFDVVVLVDAPEAERERRLVEDRGLSPEDARRMIDAQMPAAEKRALANEVLENTGTIPELERKAADLWRRIAETARERESRTPTSPGGSTQERG